MSYKVEAYHPNRHSSRSIKGTTCDGCRSMCVIIRGRRVQIEEYWCDWRHGFVDPHTVECKRGNPERGA